jgi:mRNA interferase HigB
VNRLLSDVGVEWLRLFALPLRPCRIGNHGETLLRASNLPVAQYPLRAFWEAYPPAEEPLRTWYALVDAAEWTGPADVKAMFGSADFVGDNRVIFNIGGNKYRLIVHVAYAYKVSES